MAPFWLLELQIWNIRGKKEQPQNLTVCLPGHQSSQLLSLFPPYLSSFSGMIMESKAGSFLKGRGGFVFKVMEAE